MIVVLDTNVIVSSIISVKGPPAEIRKRWENGEFEIAISPALLHELERALSYPQVVRYTKLTPAETAAIIKHLRESPNFVEPDLVLKVIEADPDDDQVLECALSAGAEYIVSGDHHLLGLKEYQGVVILDPASFIALLKLRGNEEACLINTP